MEPDHYKKHEVGNDNVQDLEFFPGLVVEVWFDLKSGGFQSYLVFFVEVGKPCAFGRQFAFLFSITDRLWLCGFHFHEFLRRYHVFTLHQANLYEIEVGEMQDEASEDEDACPHLQFGTGVCFGALRLVVALGSCHLVGDG